MCGFAGFYTTKDTFPETRLNNLKRMSQAIGHRGPDGEGFWIDSNSGISLSHRRLAIIDLTPQGHQPMASPSGRYMMVFNGEIYNYKSLREEINNLHENSEFLWRGNSDTEVMLAGFDQWGIEATAKKANGMFAFGVWDLKEKKLYLGRDRMGEKPLYYGWCGEHFLFGSELKSLKAHLAFDKELSLEAVELFLKYNYIPAPISIYKDIFKLSPGTILCLSLENIHAKELPLPQSYWSLSTEALDGMNNPLIFSETEAIDHLDQLLHQAVKQQMVADVPIGAFLSGGIDSSTIVSVMQKQSSKPIKTFTIGFQRADINEAEYAKDIARYLQTDHTEMYISDKQAMDVIPLLPCLYDEPFADSSQIPTYLVSKLAREQVTVSLSGDAGDELFGGYNRHVMAKRLESISTTIPSWGRHLLGRTLQAIPPSFLNKISELSSTFFLEKKITSQLGDKVKKLSDVLEGNKEDIYLNLVSNFKDPGSVMASKAAWNLSGPKQTSNPSISGLAQQMMLNDSLTYLPDDILVKVDRAAMGVSLETRVPMLDKDIIKFAWQLPLSMKIRDGKGKWILRQVLNKYIPSSMIDRPKQGFAIPLDTWLRGPLADWAETLLNENAIKQTGIINGPFVQVMWQQHLSGKKNWQQQLWALLMLQSWLLKSAS